ncbi:unnamed protein product [Phytophthora lilii]|uniref:NADPH--hemoprotein reductase n=1 Tax=Phytophthora lilii TaxID=2077276 RepID=A0A9W6WT09_9STRA|nr:unnamed protein product [Phytophthora lilii]
MLSWDVADISVDYINANENICPFMGHIGQLSNESPEFWDHLRDPATVEIEHHFNDLVGNFSWGSVLECLSTTRCNDLELPPGIDEETFTKTYHEVEVRQGIFLTYNDSWYAKVAMQPLAHDMLTRLNGVLNDSPDAYKLSVTMAHDSTIMPFLAASVKQNWDRTWTPYAGMLVIEVYKTKSGSHAVRMIFHGEPQLLPDCHDSTCCPLCLYGARLLADIVHFFFICAALALCDIEEFFQAFSFARNPRTEHDCKLPKKKKSKSSDSSSLMTSVADGQAGFQASDYVGSYLLLGLVGVAGLLALRAKARRNRQPARRKLLEEADRAVFEVARNDVISAPHQTTDGAWRSVRHIDLHIRSDQEDFVSEQASNIGVYVPNDLPVVKRMLAHLHVEVPSVVFVAEPLSDSVDDGQLQQSPLQHQGFPERPFTRVGTVRDALMWTFDLVSTPRPSFLRSLAAYASDENDVAALMAPQTIEAIQAERWVKEWFGFAGFVFSHFAQPRRPHQHATIADVFDRFPSVRLSFAEFFQIAPPNAPRYYTVSSSRQFVPEAVSITLGLRKTDVLPLPRCSSYLAMLKPGDSIRASFYQSSFVFPFHDHRPIMLISAGTGIAPFRAFLQDLEHENVSSPHKRRPAHLFYGCREKDVDFLYAEELQRARDSGVLDQLHVEFSGDSVKPKRVRIAFCWELSSLVVLVDACWSDAPCAFPLRVCADSTFRTRCSTRAN